MTKLEISNCSRFAHARDLNNLNLKKVTSREIFEFQNVVIQLLINFFYKFSE